MTSTREVSNAGSMSARGRDLHRKLLERVLLRSETQNVKDVFRRYDRERAGVLTVEQFRALVRDHDFLDADADLLLRHWGANDQQSVTFHTFMGDVQLGAEQNYATKNANASNSPKKVQQLSQLTETQQKKNVQPQKKNKPKGKAAKPAVEMMQDPMEAIRTKLRERVMGHSKSIREVFMEYDIDGSGFLDYEEFGRFMAKYKFTPDETQTVVDYLDRDASGTIDYDEFAAGLLFYRPPIPVPVVPVQAAPSPSKTIGKIPPQRAAVPQPTQAQTTRNSKPSKQTDFQQILDSMRSKFDETLKRSKQRTGRSRDLRAEFDRYDADGDNNLDHQEFGAFLVGLGIKLKANELREVLQEVDPNEKESIGFETIAKLLNIQDNGPMSNIGLDKGQRHQQAASKADNEVLSAFKKYDHNGTGELDYETFRQLMHNYGMDDDREISSLIDELDESGNGTINYNEFARVYSRRIKHSMNQKNEIIAAFKMHDHDGRGELDYAEFRRLMQESGVKDNDVIDALIDEIDETGSGSISFNEFSRVYDHRIKPTLKVDGEVMAIFNKYDRDGRGELDYDEFQRMMHESGVKDNELIDGLIYEIDKDSRGSISLNDFARVYDRRIKPAMKSTRQRREQESDHYAKPSKDVNVRPAKNVMKVSQVENDQNAKSRLPILQEQELQYMERVLQRHNSIENAFREFGQNEMDFEQFRDFMGHYGITDEASISMLLKRLDTEKSGTVNLQQFLSVFNAQRLARHNSSTTIVARGDQHQNDIKDAGDQSTAATIAGGHHQNAPVRTGGPTISAAHTEDQRALRRKENNTTTKPTRTDNMRNRAARLRDLEEKWIRGALAVHDSLYSAFAAVDRDHDDEITRGEFGKLMNQFGIQDNEDIAALMKKVDADSKGFIDYDEFDAIFHDMRVHKYQERQESIPIIPRRSPADKPVASAVPRRSSANKAVAPIPEPKNGRGARLRDLQIKWMKRVLGCHDSIESAFYQYDEDGSGELDHEEFAYFMKRYGIVNNDDIEALIRRLDTDGSGTISLEEFSVVFNPLRVNPGSTADEISAIAAAAAEETFDPDELDSILEIERDLAKRMARQTRDLRLAFRKFDTNGNGRLEYKEFRTVLKSYRIPEMEIRKVIRHLDRHVSGFIDYKDFIAGFGTTKEGGGAAPGAPSPKKVDKRASPVKGNTKPKIRTRRSPAKPQIEAKTQSLETLKMTLLERILTMHGTVQNAFREYDLDKEGSLNEAQFVKLVLDCEFSRDEAARLLDVFDQHQSGKVAYQEFLAQLVKSG